MPALLAPPGFRPGMPRRRLAAYSGSGGFILANGFEGMTSGAALTQGVGGNTGGASGNFFDSISTAAGATIAADNTHLGAHGVMACKITTDATGESVFAAWTTSLTNNALPGVWFRQSLYFTANPTNNHRVCAAYNGASAAASVRVLTTGTMQFTGTAGATIVTTTATIPLNQWFRIEGSVFPATSTVMLILYPTPDSTVPTEIQYATGASISTSVNAMRFGVAGSAAASVSYWFDDAAASPQGKIGPAVTLVTFPADLSAGTSDLAAFADAGSVLLSSTDAATGTDAGEIIGVTSADTFSAADAGSAAPAGTPISSTDAAAFAETSAAVDVIGADTAAAVDTQAVSPQDADTASAVEGAPKVTVLDSDAASAIDSATVRVSSADASALTADAAFLTLSSTDLASAADAQSVAVMVTSSDAGSLTDTAFLTLSDADAASAVDAALLEFTGSDAGSFTEAGALTVFAPDSATFADTAFLVLSGADAASAVDAALLGLFSADTMASSENGFQSGPIGPDFDFAVFTDTQTPPLTVAVQITSMDVNTVVTEVQVVTVVLGQSSPDSTHVNAGEKATIKVRPTDPVTLEVVKDATVTAYLFAPPKNPSVNPSDRTPDYTIPLTYDPVSNFYLGEQDTTGFAPGTWWAQGKATGGVSAVLAWEYQAFPVSA